MAVLGAAAGFRDVREWYTRIAILSDQVCLIEHDDGRPRGTAFLVGSDLLLTAAHVVVDKPDKLVARFDFIVSTETGMVSQGNRYALAPSPIVSLNDQGDLDVALLRLSEPAGEKSPPGEKYVRGWVDLSGNIAIPSPGTAIAIFQHPEGGPLKVALSTNAVVRYDEQIKRILYRTDTSPGASGGPCFDIDWRFVAMHIGHAFHLGNYNMGVPAALIVDWLRREGNGAFLSKKPQRLLKTLVSAGGAPEHGTFGIDVELKKLLFGAGEGQRLELKERATDPKAKTAKISDRLLASVAAFMNSKVGGTILIGVTNDRKFVGIESEYAVVNPQRSDWDSYAMWINSVIGAKLDVRAAFNYFNIVRYVENKLDLCAINVQPAEMPVFLSGKLYVRSGSQNTPIEGHDMLAYVAKRWSWLGSSSPQSVAGGAGVTN